MAVHEIDTTVADTILSQMGGVRVLRMAIGATFSTLMDARTREVDGVEIRYNFDGCPSNVCEIRLDYESDTYRMAFKMRHHKIVSIVSRHDNVYFDSLMDIFERQTGLYPRPPKVSAVAR